ncbi:MAG: hypothetical protein KJO69_05720 [Gammaproteobacteria bacterium]|nr:hypothetical protein [Gammaproteobacteria bacterium]
MTTINETLMNTIGSIAKVTGADTSAKWANAKDTVDYPVWITPAYYKDEDTKTFTNANGETNTGRDKEFNLVVVDKFRDGDKQCIASVTDTYGSVATKDIYNQLQQELELSESAHDVHSLFVSGNGGMQQLVVRMTDVMDIKGCPDNLEMRVVLETSVDGTKAHKLTMVAHNKTGDVSSAVYGGDYNLKARHTKTIGDRAYHFIPTINTMIANWNDLIIPTMSLMFNEKFNRNQALSLMQGMCEKAGIGERHQVAIKDLYASTKVRTNDKSDSLYRVNATISQYLEDEMEGKQELKNKFQTKVAKAMQTELNKLRVKK